MELILKSENDPLETMQGKKGSIQWKMLLSIL